jgi:hypothetical protein
MMDSKLELIAEPIVRGEGLTFALAVNSGDAKDIHEARGYLKLAIVAALIAVRDAEEKCQAVKAGTGKQPDHPA